MDEEERINREIEAVFRVTIRLGLLVQLGAKTENQAKATINEIIVNMSEIPEDVHESLIKTAFSYIEEDMKACYSEDSIEALRESVKESGMTNIEFVMCLDIDIKKINPYSKVLKDRKNFELTVVDNPNKDQIDFSAKEVGQRVYITHPLFTNMLVTSDGVQMPSKDFLTPAAEELMGIEAIVIEVNCTDHTYVCGACENRHIADVKIAFADYTMEFYINNDLLTSISYETTTERPRT